MLRDAKKSRSTGDKDVIKHRSSLDIFYKVWILLNQSRDSMQRAREKELRKHDVSSQQAAVLFIAKSIEGKVTPSEISKWMLKAPHTTSTILTRMERQGLVTKHREIGNGREVIISLTEKGEEAYRLSEKIESIRDIISCLSQEERQQLNSYLVRLRDAAIDYTAKNRVPFP
jgi:MarR family transcriptional regulator, organic hydroperoxide resistance regulator